MIFYTVGYGGRGPQQLAALLQEHGIRTVVDVRLRPDRASMGCYVKAREKERGIEKLFSDAGIAYLSLVELGNVFMDCEDWRERYEALMESAGDLLTQRLLTEAEAPFCLMCAEKRAGECHREVISEFLLRDTSKDYTGAQHL